MSGLSLRASSKFGRLCSMLKIEPPHARGLLEYLWDSVAEDGAELIGDAFDVEFRCGWNGERGKLCEALLKCGGFKAGFIEELPGEPGIYQLHDLPLNVPKTLVRKWIARREREEQGTTLSEIRRAAAHKRWDRERAKTCVDDANACKNMQTDANCTPLHTCSPSAATSSPQASPSQASTPTAIPRSFPWKLVPPNKYPARDRSIQLVIPSLTDIDMCFQQLAYKAELTELKEFRMDFLDAVVGTEEPKRELSWTRAAESWLQSKQATAAVPVTFAAQVGSTTETAAENAFENATENAMVSTETIADKIAAKNAAMSTLDGVLNNALDKMIVLVQSTD